MEDSHRQYGTWLAPLAFATAVSMWAVAYVGRLPVVMAPSSLIAILMVVALAAWGFWAGRWTGGGWRAGAAAGCVAGVVNMLILGSFLSSPETPSVVPSALWWVPGSLLLTAAVAALAAQAGSSVGGVRFRLGWSSLFARVALAATFLLIVAGGLVTSSESGLAVVDWPNSYGYNMFLYPISKMTGGIYYEHAHRLFGSLVGLSTVVLAVYLKRREPRVWVARLAAGAVVLVVVQGILGGLRVTGGFTLSTSAEDMTPSIVLAALHGVLGQIFLGVMVVLAVGVSRTWTDGTRRDPVRAAVLDYRLQAALVLILLVQLVLGAVQRHFAWGLVIHITMAAVVWMVASAAGARVWWLHSREDVLRRLGKLLIMVVGVQVVLGIATLGVTAGEAVVGDPDALAVLVATSHQACGALLLALSVSLMCWTRRLATP